MEKRRIIQYVCKNVSFQTFFSILFLQFWLNVWLFWWVLLTKFEDKVRKMHISKEGIGFSNMKMTCNVTKTAKNPKKVITNHFTLSL